MCNEKSLLVALVNFLMGHLWHKSAEVAENVHRAIWWIRALQENGDEERIGFLRRTINHQVNRVQEVARKQKEDRMLPALFDAELKQLMIDLNLVWYPDPPKPQRINELKLMKSFKTLGEVRTCRVNFSRRNGENRWYGHLQDSWGEVSCQGEVAYRVIERRDGVGGMASAIVPLAVRIETPEVDDFAQTQECRDFALELRKKWSDPTLFGTQIFLRHTGANSPANREMTTIQSQRAKT